MASIRSGLTWQVAIFYRKSSPVCGCLRSGRDESAPARGLTKHGPVHVYAGKWRHIRVLLQQQQQQPNEQKSIAILPFSRGHTRVPVLDCLVRYCQTRKPWQSANSAIHSFCVLLACVTSVWFPDVMPESLNLNECMVLQYRYFI